MHQGLRLSRPFLGLILLAFCLPLFIGLGRADLETDEAIYSFAVDRILEIGDWLEPKSSPSETAVFLEKPPLKFWLVAAPIKAGILSHTQFGLRFMDALAGSVAFAYVFAIGTLLAGPVCGAVAVLLLFIHIPLVHEHGLRTNNMEGMLFLSYCAGTFHFLRWAALDDAGARTRHIVALALWFVLGFMTKFVAALFLPFTLGLVALAAPSTRRRLVTDLRSWLVAAGLIVGVSGPWFAYAHVRFGSLLWETILGVHVVRRLTGTLVPEHLHPWWYYLDMMWQQFRNDQVDALIVLGVAALVVQTIRRRWLAGTVVLLWGAVPLAIISAGTSKLYHYAYPFLPPIMLAAGYVCALVVMLAPAPLRRVLGAVEDWIGRRWPSYVAAGQQARGQTIAQAIVALAVVLAVGAVLFGHVRLHWGNTTLFRSSGIWRPMAVILLAALATRSTARVARVMVALVVLNTMPLAAYRGQLERMSSGRDPIRVAAACLVELERQSGTPAGLYVAMPEGIWHPLYYNFRRVRPWSTGESAQDPAIERHLFDPAAARPLLLSDTVWREWVQAHPDRVSPTIGGPPMIGFLNSVLLLPGPYAACSPEARLRGAQ